MGHKISKALLALSLIAILVPLASGVNNAKQAAPDKVTSPVRMADGNPGPPVPPPPRDLATKAGAESFVIADGNPGPPVPPRDLTQIANKFAA